MLTSTCCFNCSIKCQQVHTRGKISHCLSRLIDLVTTFTKSFHCTCRLHCSFADPAHTLDSTVDCCLRINGHIYCINRRLGQKCCTLRNSVHYAGNIANDLRQLLHLLLLQCATTEQLFRAMVQPVYVVIYSQCYHPRIVKNGSKISNHGIDSIGYWLQFFAR